MSDIIPPGVTSVLDETAPVAPVDAGTPMYRIDPSSKVPVSKHTGKLWEGRIASAVTGRKGHVDAWDEAIRYYNNSQLDHRVSADNASGNRYFSKRRNNQWSETENLVYANTRAMMPALYAKNPQVEYTTAVDERKEFVQQLEDVVNKLAALKHAPGLNLKVHAKQAVISTELTNIGWLEYGYTMRDQSSLAAQTELGELAQQLVDAKDVKAIRDVEGKLMAAEEQLDVLAPPGAFVRYRPGHDVLDDPDAALPDFSDSKWRAVREYYPTSYLNARYGVKDEDSGTVKSLYEPTHVLLGGGDGEDDEIKNFKLFSKDAAASQYGYDNREQLERAYRTCCWRIWDRVTRRVYLFADKMWTWPVWVENDPYGLPGFFPMRVLYFNTSPLGAYARSNVVYYLDQQDAINEIHDEFRRARQDVKENVLYDSTFDRDSVEKWLKGGGPNAVGVPVPDGKSLKDMLHTKPNVMLGAMPLFDLQRPMASIDRISGVSDVLRNVQFKTNTTNKAIENYNSSTALRLDEKIDAIEDALGDVLYGIGFLCAQFMAADEVAMLIGAQRAEGWQNYQPRELMHMFQCEAVGGSTQKPTSQAKKQQALETAQLLQKLAQFAPTVIIETIFTLLDDAFDELTLPPDAFERMKQEAVMAMQRGNSTQGGGNGASSPPTEGTQPQPTSGSGGGGGPEDAMQQLASAVDALPPQAKIALGKVLAQGIPVMQALPEVLRAMQQTGNAQQ